MQEPHSEGVAHHAGPESCAGGGNALGEALTGENAGQVLSSEITSIGVPTSCCEGEGHTKRSVQRELPFDAAESETLCMRGHFLRGNRETRKAPPSDGGGGRSGKADAVARHARRPGVGRLHSTEEAGEQRSPVVPGAAESVEGRGPAKGNTGHVAPTPDTEPERRRARGLLGVRLAARRDRKARFTALLHHITPELLTAGFFDLKRKAVPGVDGVTWQEYRRDLEARIADLHGRIQRGAYRPRPSKRAWIPKSDGRQRPLGIAALEDKIVQQAVRTVLELIYEEDFLGFSYGFRPRRSQHNALDALSVGITRKKVNWVLDADIRGFFDAIDHEWMLRFLEHRIADRRILRLIRRWLKAGVLEDGRWSDTQEGTPQGAVITPPTIVQIRS
jgi:RNA-directed DNA polymerase